ncbi:MAG: helicase C-terminal domain-containing protein [Candidatus Korarchaeota archaeon]
MREWERYFPYSLRPEQDTIMNSILNTNSKHIILEAPAGYGKSICVLSSMLLKGRILWVVRTGTETNRPIEELKKIVKKNGQRILGISYRGRMDMCLIAEKYGTNLSWREASLICYTIKCKYRQLEKIREIANNINEPLTYNEIKEIAKTQGVCPYYLQRELAQKSRVISLSYNYVFDKRIGNEVSDLGEYLVIDEAHNLVDVLVELNSRQIHKSTIERAVKEARGSEIKDYLIKIVEWFNTSNHGVARQTNNFPLDFDIVDIIAQMGENIIKESIESGREIRSALISVASFLETYRDSAEKVLIIYPGENPSVEIFNIAITEMLSTLWARYKQVVLMSGTFGPIDAYCETIGIRNFIHLRPKYTIKDSNILSIILNDLSTRGAELPISMTQRYIEAICMFEHAMTPRNTAIFTPSYRIMNQLLDVGLEKNISSCRKILIVEHPEMSMEDVESYIKIMTKENGITLLGVAGGRFSEGVDFPGSALDGVFLVGVPYSQKTPRVDALINYYSSLYGPDKGWEYAYGYPAIRKAVQALGRPLRAPDDRAVLVCGDYRYIQRKALLPEYFKFAKIIEYTAIEKLIFNFYNV